MVTASDPLFNLSVRDNITLGRKVSEEELNTVLGALQIDSLDARMGDGSFHLSAGQQQRIRLARVMVQPATLVLLDEPFTGLDSITREKVSKGVERLLSNRAFVIVTHDEIDLQLVDTVCRMEAGYLGRPTLAHG